MSHGWPRIWSAQKVMTKRKKTVKLERKRKSSKGHAFSVATECVYSQSDFTPVIASLDYIKKNQCSTGNSGCCPRGKRAAIVRRYPVFSSVFPPCVSCFRNPPRSHMDNRIFNVRTFFCVRLQTGVGHTDCESAQHFWLGKTLTNCSCAPDGIRNSGHGIH